ncbi:hypothetical protein AADG42_13820 [Ammonicoccus fulvus]|uniref:Acyl-CoA dehydrogenase C-terminal domain-containing protein n=1 Tax=Ammonicoccus fulvus TaxID=3138240 RepID=A0ABZ3FUU0_9ACTN
MTVATVNPDLARQRSTDWIDPANDITAGILEKIHEIGPMLRDHAKEADRNRVISDEVIEAIKGTGAWQISTMGRYGGFEGGARMLFETSRTLGYYLPSAGWVTTISNGSVMLLNRFDDEVLDEVFATDPSVGMASVFASPSGTARRDGDGWRITGSWPFASNVMHSDWALGILNIEGENGAEPGLGFALMHRDQFTIEDTWYVVGMRGTGSNTMVTKDLWIPENRLITFDRMMGTGFEMDPDANFARRQTPHLTMSTTIAAPSIGATQAALDFVREKALTRPVTFTCYDTQAGSGAFRHGIGQVSTRIDSAVLLLERSADDIDRYALGTEPMPRDLRARHRGGIGHAVHEAALAMNDLMWLHGTAAFAEFNPLAALWRDVNTGARHASITAPTNYELHGCGLLGTEYIAQKL